ITKAIAANHQLVSERMTMPKTICLLLSSLALIMAFFIMPAYPQSGGATTASINGNVSDEGGAVIGGAQVSATNLDTNFTREVHSNEDGSFLITQLPPGSYEIKVTSDGFATRTTRLDL